MFTNNIMSKSRSLIKLYERTKQILIVKLGPQSKTKMVYDNVVSTWQKIQAPFLRPSMVDALIMSSISGTSVSAMSTSSQNSATFTRFIDNLVQAVRRTLSTGLSACGGYWEEAKYIGV